MKITRPNNSEIIDIQGSPNESIFYQTKKWCLSEDFVNKLQENIDKTMDEIMALNNDRLLVLVGALWVENAIDEFLSAIIPDFKSISDRNFTFSIRIELARAKRLCPSRFFNDADVIRDIRNKFVHNLSCRTFDKLPNASARSQSMRERVSKYNVDVSGKNDAEVFRLLVGFVTLAVRIYTEHIKWLNRFIRNKEFYPVFKSFCEARGGGKIS